MSNPCDGGDMCNGQTDGETRLLPVGGNGNLILCRECYKVELSFRFNRIIGKPGHGTEGIEQDMPTWESLTVSSEKVQPVADPTEVYRRNNQKPKKQ